MTKMGRPPGVKEKENRVTASNPDTAGTIAKHPDPNVQGAEDLLLHGLNQQERTIARLRMRGFSQGQIAKFLDVSQPYISKKLKKVRQHQIDRGSDVDQDLVLGQTTSLYEEIEHRAWEIYTNGDNSDKTKALQLVMTAREKQTKLLMDLGKLERQGVTNKVEVDVSPLVARWTSGEAQEAARAIIEGQLSQLAEPEPPQLEAEIPEAEFEEVPILEGLSLDD